MIAMPLHPWSEDLTGRSVLPELELLSIKHQL